MSAPGAPPTYQLSGAEFDSLGSGYGSPSALATLRSAQLSKRLLLLSAAHRGPGLDGAAWQVLRDLTAHRPDIAGDVLGHPFVDTWATRYLRSAGTPSVSPGYVSGLAVAAAVRAGVDLDLPITGHTGELYIPTVGLAYGLGDGPVTVRLRDGDLTVSGTDTTVRVPAPYTEDRPGWCVSRGFTARSAAGPLTLAIEDLDPHRACFGHMVAPRLRADEASRFESLVGRAWRIIATDFPEHAVAIAGCLRAIVPLVSPASGSVSGSSQTAFGAVGVSTPDDPAVLALLLIHETQHVKLGAVIDHAPMYDPAGDGVHHAPWRADPRPARALFQGVYAHLGVADFWRVRRTRTAGDKVRTADFEFAYWLAQTRLAARALAGSGELTAHGERFVDRLTATLDGWAAAPAGDALAAGVDDLVTAVAVRWRLDNHRPEPETAAALAAAWLAGQPCPPLDPPPVAPAKLGGPARTDGLADHLRARLTGTTAPAPAPGDTAYLEGRWPAALSAYRRAAIDVPDDPLAWIGLALAVRAGGAPDGARALAERPDLVRATYLRLRAAGRTAAPDELAAWLAAGLG